jgi:hypothetical protein
MKATSITFSFRNSHAFFVWSHTAGFPPWKTVPIKWLHFRLSQLCCWGFIPCGTWPLTQRHGITAQKTWTQNYIYPYPGHEIIVEVRYNCLSNFLPEHLPPCRQVFRFTSRPLYPRKRLWFPLSRGLGGLRTSLDILNNSKSFFRLMVPCILDNGFYSPAWYLVFALMFLFLP